MMCRETILLFEAAQIITATQLMADTQQRSPIVNWEYVGAGSIFPLLNSPGLSESWDGKGRLETPTPLRSLDLDKLGFEPPAVE